MDWDLAIGRNRDALRRVLASLVAMIGLLPDRSIAFLPSEMRCAVLRLLRPAESATRRLIVIVAQMAGERASAVAAPVVRAFPLDIPRGKGLRAPCFALLDPLRQVGPVQPPRLTGPGPRLSVPGFYEAAFEAPPVARAPVSAKRLCRRLQALRRALDDLPAQAKRLARWRARRLRQAVGRVSSVRSGRPPGFRARALHAVDGILNDCHELALYATQPPDTS